MMTEEQWVTWPAAGASEPVEAQVCRLEERLALREAQLRQAQRSETIARLAGGFAHDFNNVVGVILGYSDLLLARSGLDPALRSALEEINRAAERASHLTAQLRSATGAPRPAPLDVGQAVTSFEKLLRRVLGEDVRLVVQPAPGYDRIVFDPGQLAQVLLHLAGNARDAMPVGGTLTIATEPVDLPAPRAGSQGSVPPGRYLALSVRDTGQGMDEATLARCFEPFFTSRAAEGRLGLGLATVREIVGASGGHVALKSTPGRGTTVTIYFPRVGHTASAPDAGAAGSLLGSAGNSHQAALETILLVEDEAMLRILMRGVLERKGYTVVEATNGDDALDLVRDAARPLDLLVTDVMMPGITGQALATEAARLRPDLRVLFMSGYTGDAMARQGVIEQDVPFLQKPFTPTAFERKVREVLDASAPVR